MFPVFNWKKLKPKYLSLKYFQDYIPTNAVYWFDSKRIFTLAFLAAASAGWGSARKKMRERNYEWRRIAAGHTACPAGVAEL